MSSPTNIDSTRNDEAQARASLLPSRAHQTDRKRAFWETLHEFNRIVQQPLDLAAT